MYRWIVALLFLSYTIQAGDVSGVRFFISFEHWSLLVFLLHLLWSAFFVSIRFLQLHVFCRDRFEIYHDRNVQIPVLDKPAGCCGRGKDNTIWYQKIQWLLFTVGNETAFAAAIFYWALTYKTGTTVSHIVILTRAVAAAVAFLDVWVSGLPIRLLHFIYPVIFGAFYVIFTGIYYAARGVNSMGDRFTHPVLDYGGSPGTAAAYGIVSTLVVLPLIHLFFWGMYILREGFIRNVCPRNRFQEGDNEEVDKGKTELEAAV